MAYSQANLGQFVVTFILLSGVMTIFSISERTRALTHPERIGEEI